METNSFTENLSVMQKYNKDQIHTKLRKRHMTVPS